MRGNVLIHFISESLTTVADDPLNLRKGLARRGWQEHEQRRNKKPLAPKLPEAIISIEGGRKRRSAPNLASGRVLLRQRLGGPAAARPISPLKEETAV